jgi:integrase
MASIYSKRGILYIKYYIDDISGNRKCVQHSLKIKDTRENRKIAKLIQKEKELELMKPRHQGIKYNLNLEGAFKLFLISKKNVSDKTIYNYNKMYEHLTMVLNKNLIIKDILRQNIEDYEQYLRMELKLSPNSVASYFKDLNTFWNWMLREKLVSEKLIWRIKQEAKPIMTIPDKDFETILIYLKKRSLEQYRFIKFLRLTGFRIGEAISLCWEDIDYKRNRILLINHKSKRNDEFPLYYALKKFLHTFKEEEGKIFKYQNADSLKFWWRAMDKLEMKYSLHSIRKTFATKLVNKKVSVFDAMKLLRHKNVITTMRYYTYADLQRLGDEANKVFNEGKSNDNESTGIRNNLRILRLKTK